MVRFLDLFHRTLLGIGALFMFATLLAILLGAAGRQFGFDIPGLDAYAGYSIAAALFLAAPAALRNGDHIRVTLVLNKLSGTARKVADFWCLLAASGVSFYLAYYSARLVWVSYITHDVSPSSDMTPLWIPQLAVAIGSAGLFLAFAEDLCRMIASQERNAGEPAEMLRVE
jgi:TRAP-type C4-dicarboxylate transport system permease small subunit